MRRLTLRKETLAELSPGELGAVVGGATTNCPFNTVQTCGGPCHSDFQQCITGLGCLSVTGC